MNKYYRDESNDGKLIQRDPEPESSRPRIEGDENSLLSKYIDWLIEKRPAQEMQLDRARDALVNEGWGFFDLRRKITDEVWRTMKIGKEIVDIIKKRLKEWPKTAGNCCALQRAPIYAEYLQTSSRGRQLNPSQKSYRSLHRLVLSQCDCITDFGQAWACLHDSHDFRERSKAWGIVSEHTRLGNVSKMATWKISGSGEGQLGKNHSARTPAAA